MTKAERREYNRKWMAASRSEKRRKAAMTLGEILDEPRRIAALMEAPEETRRLMERLAELEELRRAERERPK